MRKYYISYNTQSDQHNGNSSYANGYVIMNLPEEWTRLLKLLMKKL